MGHLQVCRPVPEQASEGDHGRQWRHAHRDSERRQESRLHQCRRNGHDAARRVTRKSVKGGRRRRATTDV